ncbi:arsenate reductase (glutaredoxin) [Halomonas denitrificans]|uniref:arsenate reductase (glutaredoxin) n=1 Tax=Halomonas TaxID=2745 RepID=UPI001A8DF490|nr:MULTISPECIES: arsenate reductase (glutaredoxin) [Halomonas]MED5294507.1 arsenate reductase (glutaredoxin) [Pseudomonadota bacterium]MBN8411279.1 arsenate reductase (glutaredoxin) [Halomonas litopenaei]MBY5925905.1 arsenate reductase (glutaredoxin) [Halomonas sp. DP4Y7-2]MBY5927637.1 arsenate reductase (glutaredoxin) [Halomonas sp. DP8Y7-3]MBY5969722.1 arsenate reductase (glutaredoxin) [Halomonas denitrificans]
MATLVLLHNPRCSKSREALALLEEAGIEAQVRRYLDDPLNGQELRELIARLDGSPRDLVRTNETEWKTLGADRDDPEQVIAAIQAHPRILQRPILDDGQRAVIGRPPEDIKRLF